MPSDLKKTSVLGLPLHLADNYIPWLINRLNNQESSHIVTLNAEMAMLGEHDAYFSTIVKQAELIIPDGSGVVLYLKMRGISQKRTPGIELAENLLKECAKQENSPLICFFGGKPGIAEAAAENWRNKCPNLEIITNHGYITPEEEQDWIELIKERQPKIIFVALGVPRQEYWIAENKNLVSGAIFMGVGGSFDIWSGIKTRAPKIWQKLHLEWLFRLYQEPWRWRRMLALPKFFFKSLK